MSESRVSQLVSDGVLDSTTIRGNRRIARDSVEQYLNQRRGRGRVPTASKPSTQRFMLMNAAHEIMPLLYDPSSDQPLVGNDALDAARAPISVLTSGGKCKRRELNEWWEHRSIPNSRPGFERKAIELGLNESRELPLRSLGLSLSDCYWLRPEGHEDITWTDVNYFKNEFICSPNGDWDDWLSSVGLDSPDNTSEGELPKKWIIRDGKRMLVKGSGNDDQRPSNELVATALHERLLTEDEFVRYEHVETKDGIACACENFLRTGEEYVPAVHVKRILASTRGNSHYDRFCRFAGKLGMDEHAVRQAMGKMIVCDHILANSDRHWRNFGFIRNVETLEMRPAPLFDSGNSLWFSKSIREVQQSDWSFVSRPFSTIPEEQLSFAEHLDWFNADALDGLVEQALDLLSFSTHASTQERLAFIAKGLEDRIASTSAALAVLRYR